jgi:aminoglycoside phosphotransferase (APT) family kinase protein
MLAALHRVDPDAVGLGGEQETTLEAEIARWTKAFTTVDDTMNARYEEAEKLLFDTMPRALPFAICHGDYRLGNMLCDGSGINAIIDWEIWSRSDPRLDLAWFLFFTDEAKHPMASNTGASGMPAADDLLRAYVEESGTAPADFEWFHCLIRYVTIPQLTVECIDRLRAFSPST